MEMIASGMSAMLMQNPDFEVKGRTQTESETLQSLVQERSDLLLLGPNMSGRRQSHSNHNQHLAQKVKLVAPATKIVATSAAPAREYIEDESPSAIDGAVWIRASEEDFFDALYKAFEDQGYLTPRLARDLVYSEHGRTAGLLSKRELDVLQGIAFGYTNKQIGENLHLSMRTVETHRASIMGKLGLHDRAQLVHYALQIGLLKEPDPHWQEES